MQNTENIGLKLYEGTDKPNYATYNQSMNILDENLSQKDTMLEDINQTMNSMENSIQTLENGLENVNDSIETQETAIDNIINHINETRDIEFRQYSTNATAFYTTDNDNLFPLPNYNDDLLSINQSCIRFKAAGTYMLTFGINVILQGASSYTIADYMNTLSRFALLKNPTFTDGKWGGGVQQAIYDWHDGSMCTSVAVIIQSEDINMPFYPVLKAVGRNPNITNAQYLIMPANKTLLFRVKRIKQL